MKGEKLFQIFKQDLNVGEVLFNESMKKNTSFKIGGPADIMILPNSEEELIRAIDICMEKNIDYFIIGNGTNILVSDKGIRGVVIKIGENFSNINIEKNKIIVQSGALLTVLSKKALKHSLTGLEFASGIPGTVGGAIAMNAGAYGGEIKNVVYKVKVLNKQGEVKKYSREDMNFRYRGSKVQDEGLIVLEVEIVLKKGNYEEIKTTMNSFTERRVSKQPLNLASAGSTFKRPEGYYAGKLIEDAGLKGLRYGDAQVSEKHSGFIVNLGKATSDEVQNLIKVVQKVVKDKYNVKLEPELKIIGEK